MLYHKENAINSSDPILLAAIRIITQDGEGSLTMDRLADECSLSRATLYRKVGSRASLLKRISSEQGLQYSQDPDLDIRSRILSATLELISTTGSLQFGMEQVAEEAGLGVVTIYRHFGTKDNLLECIAEQTPRMQSAFEFLEHTRGDVQADLERFATQVLQGMQSQGELSRLIFSGDARVQKLFRSNRTDQERTLSILTRYLSEQIKEGRLVSRDPFNLATTFFGMILGFAFVKPVYAMGREDPQQVARFIVQIFLQGIQNKPGRSSK